MAFRKEGCLRSSVPRGVVRLPGEVRTLLFTKRTTFWIYWTAIWQACNLHCPVDLVEQISLNSLMSYKVRLLKRDIHRKSDLYTYITCTNEFWKPFSAQIIIRIGLDVKFCCDNIVVATFVCCRL